MQTKRVEYQPYLDGWRGLAITFLLVGHFFPVAGINLGAVGVNLFFVLSGLLMARVLFVHGTTIPRFYRRRVARIFPSVAVFLVVMLVMYALTNRDISWVEVLAALGFLINYFPGEPGAAVMPFGHIWSLCVEEHSYVALSIVAVAVRVRRGGATTALALLSVAVATAGIWYWSTYTATRLEFDRWIHSEVSAFGIFASGFFLLHFCTKSQWPRHFLIVPILVLIGIVSHWWSVPAPVRTIIGCGAFALAINLLESSPNSIRAVLSLYPLRQLGMWSFSIYLWQQPFYLLMHREGWSNTTALATALAVAILAHYTIEEPARRYLNRTWGSAVLPDIAMDATTVPPYALRSSSRAAAASLDVTQSSVEDEA
jgi:peptidoglycan/LPS O-acetylase OafA/YrhL